MKKLKIGTKVFDVRYGWGKIIETYFGENYPYIVHFINYPKFVYSIDGKFNINENCPTLSLTEYSLEKGGFTPIDTESPLQVGEMAYFWNENPYSLYLVLSSFDGVTYSDKVITSCGFIMDKASREIPQWFLDKFQNK
jgi:hypothetical protein